MSMIRCLKKLHKEGKTNLVSQLIPTEQRFGQLVGTVCPVVLMWLAEKRVACTVVSIIHLLRTHHSKDCTSKPYSHVVDILGSTVEAMCKFGSD